MKLIKTELLKMKNNVFTKTEYIKFPYLHFFTYQYVNGVYSFRYHRNGQQKNISSKILEKAKIKVIEYCNLLYINCGIIPESQKNTFNEFAEKWLNIVKKPNVNKDTYRVYRGVYLNYIKPIFENKYFSDISLFELQEFFNNLPAEKGKTRENIKIVLNGIYQFAYMESIIDKNPMERVIVKRHIRKKGKCLTFEDEKRFLESIKGSSRELAWLIMLYSGVRPGELATIEFNWLENVMTIKNGKLKESQKEYEYRTIPIFPKLKALMPRIREEEWKHCAYALSRNFPRFCPNYRLYDLRHTFITRTKECGVHDELVSLWTGHELGKSVTANVYTHYQMSYQQEQALKVEYEL